MARLMATLSHVFINYKYLLCFSVAVGNDAPQFLDVLDTW